MAHNLTEVQDTVCQINVEQRLQRHPEPGWSRPSWPGVSQSDGSQPESAPRHILPDTGVPRS